MHSGELARLAGVTVRALRHYHQVGVLAEPERGNNGYRDYDVHDLIRVLRIRRLASLGIPLERMRGLLDEAGDDTSGGAGALLDELDAELAEQIDRLAGQRDLIARLREHSAFPDLPPDLAPFLAAFAAAGLSPELARIDRDQSVLLAHLVGEDGMPGLVRFYERVSESSMALGVADLVGRFGRLGPGSTDEDITALVTDFAEALAPVLLNESDPLELGGSESLLSDYTTDVLNEQQQRALDQLATVLEEAAQR